MADIYVWSGATGAGSGVDWFNAYTKLETAVAAKLAGDVFYVAHDHSQTQAASLTISFPGTEANPNRVYCVDRNGSVPPSSADLRTTAVIAITGNNFTLYLNNTVSEFNGFIFLIGDGGSGTTSITVQGNARSMRLVNCYIKLNTTNGGSRINIGATSAAYVVWENVAIEIGINGQWLAPNGRWIWRNTPNAFNGALTNLLIFPSVSVILLEGIDLSAYGPGKTLIGGTSVQNCFYLIKDCKFATGTIICTPVTTAFNSQQTTATRSDVSDTTYRTEFITGTGSQVTDTTVVRTGGASDGTQVISWKIVTSGISRWEMPFECLPITLWNDAIGSPRTVTIQGIWGTAALPKNDDIWIDVLYSGISGSTMISKASSTKANGLAANADLPAGTGTWLGGSVTKFALAVTFTPQRKGPFTIYVKAAKLNSTYYIDPKPVIT
jgi:hypothetical protein